MQSRFVVATLLCFESTLALSQVITRGETVCWGQHESNCTSSPGDMGPSARAENPPEGFGPKTMFFRCDHGGPSRGFDGPYVCKQVCGSSEPSHCTIWTNEHGSKGGDACGYRWARVTCGTNPPVQELKRLESVCWGDKTDRLCPTSPYPRQIPPRGFSIMTKHYPCGSGGHSGYNPPWVCQDLCGSSESFRCTNWSNEHGSKGGGACGMRWTRVACF
ncbi:hypothetical protein ABIF73_004436 [Bradyrhizobium japonicum]